VAECRKPVATARGRIAQHADGGSNDGSKQNEQSDDDEHGASDPDGRTSVNAESKLLSTLLTHIVGIQSRRKGNSCSDD
jgi:hypothetical protein